MSRASLSRAVRTSGVLVAGAYGLHQLTYLVAGGSNADQLLVARGHGYLPALAPPLIAAAVCVVLVTLLATAILPTRPRPSRPASLETRGALLAVAFLAVFASQELAEGALIASHPHGLAALAECWMALPLALPIGALAALVLGGLDRADRLIATARERRRVIAPRAPRAISSPSMRRARGSALSCMNLVFGLARRGPPLPAHL